MLRFLSVQNLAVIEAAELELDQGLTVLTGETGAGKSILVEAIGLLLGGRASPDLVRTGEASATIQAVFDTADAGELIIRREITAQGRSRAFVNGELVTAATLRDLGARLVDLHGQHEHQALLDAECHLDVLDRFAGADGARSRVEGAFAHLQAARRACDATRQQAHERAARTEAIEFQLAELDRIKPHPGEDEELATLRTLLASAERLSRLAAESYSLLYDRDDAVLAGLGQVWRRVGELATLDPRFLPYAESREAIKSQLEDLATFLRGYAASIDASPARLQEVEDRLASLERLKRKHGPTLGDVLLKHELLRRELSALDAVGERLSDCQTAVATAARAYVAAAQELSAIRRVAAVRFGRALEAQVAELAMEQTRFEVRFGESLLPEDRWLARGFDLAEFYVSPNPGEDLRPLSRIVSGGELSRIMLGIKSLASLDDPGKTLVFDEVDVGIGGRVADAVGGKLRGLGTRFQVLCITHLPQIAAYGSQQYRIQKDVRDGRTVTSVVRLDRPGREEELARMIGGAAVSDGARQSAREMLASRLGEGGHMAKGESETAKAKVKATVRER